MLEYQELDKELVKLNSMGASSADRANLAKLKGYIVEFNTKGFKIEEDAGNLLNDYNKLVSQYNANCDKVQALTSTDLSKVTLDKVDGILSQINALSSELFLLERNINIILTKIKSSLKEFDITKKNIIKAKEKYKECKEKCDKVVEQITPQVKSIEAKMATLEKELKPDELAKYKTMKADKIFPVYVPFVDGHCSGCRVEIPTSKINKLKADGTIICEQCHRIIYNK